MSVNLYNPTNLGAPGPIGGTTASSAAFTQIAVTSTSSSVSALSLTQTVAANSSVVAGINAVNNVSGTLALPNVYTGHLFQITDTSNAFVFGANFQQSLNSSTWKGPKTTLSSNLFVNATSTSTPGTINDYNLVSFGPGIQGGANVNPAFNVSLWAENPVIIVTGTGYGTILGAEYDFNIDAAGSAKNRIGIQIVADGICGTDGADYAYLFGSANSAATWDYGITWYGNSVKPSTGTLIGSQNATSAGFGVDFNNVTFGSSGFAFRSPGFSVGPTGALTYGATTLTTAVTGTGKMVLSASPTFTGTVSLPILSASAGVRVLPTGSSAAKMLLSSDATGSENFYMEFLNHDESGSPGTVQFTGRFLADMPLLNINATSTVHSGSVTATAYKVGSNQVVGARSTGWTNQTATASKADLGASPTVAQLAAFCSAVDVMLKAHGLTST